MSAKTTKILYWVFNGLFALAMLATCIDSIQSGPESVAFIHTMLGYPEYIIPFTAWMKVIGCIIILVPAFPRLKEWAYAGLCLDLFLAIYSIGATMGLSAESWPIFVYVVLAALAYYTHIQKQKLDGKAISN
jgi:uncharacterized membrane protein YphA (DoxX/SURF4 family)